MVDTVDRGGITIYLMRHGDTGYSGRYLGATDVGITEKGREQIEKIRPSLFAASVETIWVSPMRRCRQSLDILLEESCYFGRETVLPELREIDFGRWEKKSFAELLAEEPELVRKWVEEADFTFPEGESVASFRGRMEKVKQHIDMLQTNSLLIVAHGGVIRSLLCLLLGLQQDRYLLFDIAPARITEILYFKEGGGVLRRCNATTLS